MNGATTCPRCGQPIFFRKDNVTIYPHQDTVTQDRCPMGGVPYDDAKRQVEDLRARIKAMR